MRKLQYMTMLISLMLCILLMANVLMANTVKQQVENSVMIISTCAEDDPRIKETLKKLAGLDEKAVAEELILHLKSKESAVRRAAIYILWQGKFKDIKLASKELIKLCKHKEEYTRGMAALALGEKKVKLSYDELAKMTLKDKSSYARRCGAYALGLLGDAKARPVLEKALKDTDTNVKNNAQAALDMISKSEKSKSEKNN